MTDRDAGNGPEFGDPTKPEVGSVTEEAAKLFSVLQDWAGTSEGDRNGGVASGVAEGLRSVGDHVGGGEQCRYCPVCRLLEALRGVNPEAREHLAAAVGSLAKAITVSLRHAGPDAAKQHQRDAPTKVHLDSDDPEA